MVSTRAPSPETSGDGSDRPRRWTRRGLFRPEAEGDRRRRPGDWVRVGVAAVVLVAAARHAGDVTRSERALFDLFNTIPANVAPAFRALYRLGTLWAVGLVAVAALVANRWRLARDLLCAGVVAWIAGRAIGEIVVAHEGIARSVRLVTTFGGSPSFPTVRLAVTVAVIGAAAPYVSRPARVFGWALIALLAVSAMYLGTAYPDELVGGLVLGWGVAALVHLVFGSPGSRPTTVQVVSALARLGIDARDARLSPHQPKGSTVVLAEDDEGPLRIKVIGRDEAESRLLAKAWSSLVYRDSGAQLSWTREQQVEREAYLILVAAQAGVSVPRVVAAGDGGPSAAVLVTRPIVGPRLADLQPEEVDDELLDDLWRNVARLHGAHVAHNDLDPAHVIVGHGRAWIVGFDAARPASTPERTAADVAQLLAATAALVGEERAVRAAADVLGAGEVGRALPFLQPAALSGETRALSPGGHRALVDRLERLREHGAAAAGIEPPRLERLRRVTFGSAAMAIGTLVAVAVLLADIGDPTEIWNTVHGAEWGWIGLAMVLSLLANVAYAIGLQGTVAVRLPIVETTELQLGMSFSNLAIPGLGGQGMQVRFLQKLGVDLSSAVAAGGVLSAFGGLVAALGLFVLALAVEPAQVDLSLIPTNGLLLTTVIVVVVVALASAVVGFVPRLRAAVMPPVVRALSTMWVAVRSPNRLALLVGGNVGATLLSTWCLQACLVAFGGGVSFWALLAANVGVVTIASIVPIPGGGTAVGTVGLSAVLVSFGVGREVAVAAVLANQLVYYYLPAIPGWFATRDLVRRDYL